VDTQEIETLKQKIAQLEKENSERVTELQSKEVEIGALNEQMNAMRDQMPQAAVPDDVAQLKQRMTLLEEELNDRLTQIQTQDIEINRLNEELSAAIKGGPIGDAPAALQPGPEDQEISRLNALLNEVDGGKAGGPGLKGLSDQDRARIAELEDALRDRDAKRAHIGKEIDSMRGAITAGEKALKEKEAELASVRDRSGDSGAKITALEKELSAVKASLDKEKELPLNRSPRNLIKKD
jgi:chromosome segregation ATPase